ncbi:unnamed protein product [Durusdinium trenchii]|uniref:Uncharacterized protein n=1 Tax=Durusdinium trenchii TaxID=1381693 RepID=A0ABP0K7A9_9DINO
MDDQGRFDGMADLFVISLPWCQGGQVVFCWFNLVDLELGGPFSLSAWWCQRPVVGVQKLSLSTTRACTQTELFQPFSLSALWCQRPVVAVQKLSLSTTRACTQTGVGLILLIFIAL